MPHDGLLAYIEQAHKDELHNLVDELRGSAFAPSEKKQAVRFFVSQVWEDLEEHGISAGYTQTDAGYNDAVRAIERMAM